MNTRLLLLAVFVFMMMILTLFVPEQVAASGPVIARGAQREAIKSQPILKRQNRAAFLWQHGSAPARTRSLSIGELEPRIQDHQVKKARTGLNPPSLDSKSVPIQVTR